MSQSLPRLIVCAAMKMKDGSIILGIRHFHPHMRAVLKRLYGDSYKLQVAEQGFVDQSGVFVDRKEAWKIAEEAGQIRRQVSGTGTLYSENLF